MTNTPTPRDYLDAITRSDDLDSDSAIDTIFNYLIDDRDNSDNDLIILAILNLLDPDDLRDLRISLDICPIHHCDAAICADDDIIDCAADRA